MIRTIASVAMCLLHCILVFVAYDVRWESDLPTRALVSSAIMVNMIACLSLNFKYMQGRNGDASREARARGLAFFTAIIGLVVYTEIVGLPVNRTGIQGGLIPLLLFLALPGQLSYHAITLCKNRARDEG